MKITADELIEALKKLPDFDKHPNEQIVLLISAQSVLLGNTQAPPYTRTETLKFYKDHREKKWRLA